MSLPLAHEIDLPMLPDTVAELLALLDDADVDIDEIKHRISTEPTLVARLLTLANSPFYGRRWEVLEVSSAIMTVGQTSVQALVLGLAIDSILNDDSAIGPEWWDRAVLIAASATSLASHLGADTGAAFCAGLLCDIGELAIAMALPAEWEAAAGLELSHDDEIARFGVHHAALGGTILESFGLPDALVAAIAKHHDPDAISGTPLERSVYSAAALASALEADDPVTETDRALDSLQLSALDAAALHADIEERVDRLRSAFSS